MDRLESKRKQVLDALGEAERLGRKGRLMVGQVMTQTPSCVSPEMNALELIRVFHAKQFRHLLVTSEGRLVGVISDRDVIRCLGPDRSPPPDVQRETLTRITAAEIMSRDLVTAGPEMPLEKATGLILDEGISCLPVVSEGNLLGILTNTDLHLVLQILLQAVSHANLAESLATVLCSRHN